MQTFISQRHRVSALIFAVLPNPAKMAGQKEKVVHRNEPPVKGGQNEAL